MGILPLAQVVAQSAADPSTPYQIAIGGLVAAVCALFGLLVASKNSEIVLAKEVYPAATLLMRTVETLTKLLDKLEQERGRAGGHP